MDYLFCVFGLKWAQIDYKKNKRREGRRQIYTEEEHRLVKELAEMFVEGYVAIYEQGWKKEDEAKKEADMHATQIILPLF